MESGIYTVWFYLWITVLDRIIYLCYLQTYDWNPNTLLRANFLSLRNCWSPALQKAIFPTLDYIHGI